MNSTGTIGARHTDARFTTTHWSAVCAAGQIGGARARDALARLCQTYWYPLYAYVRGRGYAPADAQDLTQGFFSHLLAGEPFRDIKPEGGKFRSFLLVAMKHFLIDEWRKVRVEKRGGGRIFPLDMTAAETRFCHEPIDPSNPERLFDQNWAVALLETVYSRLESEHQARGKAGRFDALKFCLTGERSAVPYEQLAIQMEIPVNSVKTLVRRLRARYRELLREEVAKGLADPADAEEELRHLFRVLAGN